MRRGFDIFMRILTSLVGLLMICSGAVWMMQGLGVGPKDLKLAQRTEVHHRCRLAAGVVLRDGAVIGKLRR